MQYNSTRNKNVSVSAAQAILNGLSSDGGLFVPENLPKVSEEFIKKLANAGYTERAEEILKLFLTDFSESEIKNCVLSAYTAEKFESDNTAPLKKLNDTTYFLELWHGPTCAFKDMALQILPHLLTTSMKKVGDGKEIAILVATSGDTGKAALEGFKNVEGTKIIVFFPQDGVSEIQKLQMITQEGSNVFVASVNGNFYDAQSGVKSIFTDASVKEELAKQNVALSSANSINWGRLVPQIIYYFSAYCDLLKNSEITCGEEINIVVPTGNFGNILAAFYAKQMGVPIKKLICASNVNNVLTDFINTGTYNKNRGFNLTISPSMDILISSNLERLLYHLSDENDVLVSDLMKKLSTDGEYTVPEEIKNKISSLFWAGCANDEETKCSIKETYNSYNYVVDTHTAVGKNVYDKYVAQTKDTAKTVIASTASPYKFNRAVLSAIKEDDVTEPDEFKLLSDLSALSSLCIPKSLSELKTKQPRFNKTIEKTQMESLVKEFLN